MFFFKECDGWEDLGTVCGVASKQQGHNNYDCCMFCKHKAHIGRDAEGLFKFCPRCLTKSKSTK